MKMDSGICLLVNSGNGGISKLDNEQPDSYRLKQMKTKLLPADISLQTLCHPTTDN